MISRRSFTGRPFLKRSLPFALIKMDMIDPGDDLVLDYTRFPELRLMIQINIILPHLFG